MDNKGETRRLECKHLLPRAGSQRKSLELCWREGWRKPSWLSQRGAGTAQNELLWVLRRVNAGLDLCIRYRMHFWRRKPHPSLFPWINSQFCYTGSGVSAFGLHLLFPTLLPVTPGEPGGSRSHLISRMGFYRALPTLQGTKVPQGIRKPPELAVGQSLGLAAVW